jgi:hypothetical protein
VCSLVCITDGLLPRHLRGFDLFGAKSGATDWRVSHGRQLTCELWGTQSLPA